MGYVNTQSFQQSQITPKGACLRLAVKWAATTLCGGTVNFFQSREEWLGHKSMDKPEGRWRERLATVRHEMFGGDEGLQKLVLASSPAVGADKSRWTSTLEKHRIYSEASEQAPNPEANRSIAFATIKQWSANIARRHGKAIDVQEFNLQNKGHNVCVAYQLGSLPSRPTLVLTYVYNNADRGVVGGHAIAYSNSMIFDPSGGLFQTGSWEDGLPLLDVDQYAWDHYGRPISLYCYALSLRG